MFDGLKDFLQFIKNDRTRIVIRMIAVILIAVQIVRLFGIPINGFIPSWILDALNLLVIPAVFFGSLILVIVIVGVVGYFSRLMRKKSIYSNETTRRLEYFLAIVIAVAVMFSNQMLAYIFAVIGLVLFLIFDLFEESRRKLGSNARNASA
ncbi:MAG: hypothetical protein IPO91_28850 [Chloroflexi bacterium]|nr:hypothetical protein [Chloroflexota bacterium]